MRGEQAARFVSVEFSRFKAFKKFTLSLRHFNILVGPNNAGKSTILAAFRILAAGMRRAYSRRSEVIAGPKGTGPTHGYRIDLSNISIAEENLFYNYDDSEPAINPERIRSLKLGMETTLGGEILAAAVLDRDYRSEPECAAIKLACERFCSLVTIHRCKEIENFVLVPNAIDRAAGRRVADRARRSGATEVTEFAPFAEGLLSAFAQRKKSYVQAQYLAFRRAFERQLGSGVSDATLSQDTLEEFEALWASEQARLAIIPGKEALSAINAHLQDAFALNITPTAIVDAMTVDEVPGEMRLLIADLAVFSSQDVREVD